MLELYTSEGCSSCPRADEWMTSLKHSKRLWKEVVPVAFHVDIWDMDGWKDRLSSADHTARQRAYAQKWGVKKIYTPMFVENGREYRKDYRSLAALSNDGTAGGLLEATQTARNTFDLRYRPTQGTGLWRIHFVLLGFNILSHVSSGENRGDNLKHDFAVLFHSSQDVETKAGVAWAGVRFPETLPVDPIQKAVVFWVSAGEDPTPVQVLGGFLSKEDS